MQRRTRFFGAGARVGAFSIVVIVVAFALSFAAPAHAQSSHRTYELKHELALDITVTAGAVTLMLVTESFKDRLAPSRCRWCDRDGAGNDVLNPVDAQMRRWLRWNDGAPARHVADTTAFLIEPATMFGTMAASAVRDRREADYPLDMLLVVEAVALSGLVNQLAKFTFARERPFVHALPDEEEKAKQAHASDNNLSFYSGHTSLTFAIAAASGTIASLRDYRLAPLVWATLVPMAALTGFMRVAADRHYFTDVLAGAVIGSAVGVLVPLVFHGRRGNASEAFGAGASSSAAPVSNASMTPPPMVTFGGAF